MPLSSPKEESKAIFSQDSSPSSDQSGLSILSQKQESEKSEKEVESFEIAIQKLSKLHEAKDNHKS